MEGQKGGEVIAEAKALTGVVVAMMSALMVHVTMVDGTMIGIIITKAGAEDAEAQVLVIGEVGAEALGERGIIAQSVKAVRRDVLKLSNGIVKGSNRKMQIILRKMLPIITRRMVEMNICGMMIRTISNRSRLHFQKFINPDYITLPGLSLNVFPSSFLYFNPSL